MAKISLTIEELAVESYVTSETSYEFGTVDAAETLPTVPLCSKYCPASTNCTVTCTLDYCC